MGDMGDREYRRDGKHEELASKVDFNTQIKLVQAEILCWGLVHIGNAIFKVADALQPAAEPKWAKRWERHMADIATALTNLQAADQRVVDELQKLADEVRAAPDVQAAADAVQAEADRLQEAVDNAETPPAPAPAPDPGGPVPDPTPPVAPGDQPPADNPPTV